MRPGSCALLSSCPASRPAGPACTRLCLCCARWPRASPCSFVPSAASCTFGSAGPPCSHSPVLPALLLACSDFAEQTRRRLEEAARRKEAEEREAAAQRYQRKEYRTGKLTGVRKLPGRLPRSWSCQHEGEPALVDRWFKLVSWLGPTARLRTLLPAAQPASSPLLLPAPCLRAVPSWLQRRRSSGAWRR